MEWFLAVVIVVCALLALAAFLIFQEDHERRNVSARRRPSPMSANSGRRDQWRRPNPIPSK